MLSNQGPWFETCPASPAPLIFCAVPVTEQIVMWCITSTLQLGQLHIVLRCCSIVVPVSPGVTLFPTGYYELHFATSFCHASKRPGLKHLLLPKGEVRCKLLHQERRSLQYRGVMRNQVHVSCLRSRMRHPQIYRVGATWSLNVTLESHGMGWGRPTDLGIEAQTDLKNEWISNKCITN